MEYSYCSQETTELSKALINVQRHLQPCIKDATNPFHKNKYATLNAVMDSCRNALLDNGILLTQYPVPIDGEYLGLVTKLTHCDTGQYQASLAKVPLAKNDAQAFGSALTYCRRYTLSAMLGIVTEDDDGNAASMIDTRKSQSYRNPAQTKSSQRTDVSNGKKVSLTGLLTELGLGELIPEYRLYLQEEYGCEPEKLKPEQSREQKAMLESCCNDSLAKRNLMRTLHGFK